MKTLASKPLVKSCLFAFFIVHTINSLVINAPQTYITHMNSNEAGSTNDTRYHEYKSIRANPLNSEELTFKHCTNVVVGLYC